MFFMVYTFRIAVPVGLITTFTTEMVAGGGRMGGDADLLAAVLREPDGVCLHRSDVVYRASSRLADVELPTPLSALYRRLTTYWRVASTTGLRRSWRDVHFWR
jgi:hypothetical protein